MSIAMSSPVRRTAWQRLARVSCVFRRSSHGSRTRRETRPTLMMAALAFALAAASPVFSQSPSTASLTAAAEQVAGKLAISLKGIPTVTSRTNTYGWAWWDVDYKDVGTFMFDATGALEGVVVYGPPVTLSPASAPPLLPESEAVRLATQVLATAGMPSDLGPASAELVMSGETESGEQEWEWYVSWPREYAGWPYEGAGAGVYLSAVTGALHMFVIQPPPPPPSIVVVRVSEEAATRIALDHAASLGETLAAPVTSARLEIAQPCLYWSSAVLGRAVQGVRYDDPTRLIWRVELAEQTSEDLVAQGYPATRAVAYVQIDAATGAVVGDAHAGGTFANPHPKPGAASSTPSAPPRAKQRGPLLRGIEGPLLLSLLPLFALAAW